MAETYDIAFLSEKAGTAQVEKEGLYLRFSCRCRMPDEGLYRIHVLCGDAREDLGICVPMGGDFGMDKRLPMKRLGEGELTFQLVPKDWSPQEISVIEKPEPMLHEKGIMEEETVPEQMLPEMAEDAAAEAPTAEMLFPETSAEIFVPVSEEEPFEHLDKLEDAHMEICNDVPGIVISEKTEG